MMETTSPRAYLLPTKSKLDLLTSFQQRGYNLCSPTATATSSHSSESSTYGTNDKRSASDILTLREPKHGQTALHLATRKADLSILQALLGLSYGRSLINVVDNNGNSCLHFAVASRKPYRVEIARLLLDAGADVNAVNLNGLTPLGAHMLTLKKDDSRLVQLLVEAGANPNIMIHSKSLLKRAVEKEFFELACYLVCEGASITERDDQGNAVCEFVSRPVLIKFISLLFYAPRYVTPGEVNHCMQCRRGVFTDGRQPKRGLVKSLQSAFSRKKLIDHRNCFHCGLIFCEQCTRDTINVMDLPSTFRRNLHVAAEEKQHACSTCINVLRVRKKKENQSRVFNSKLGWDI